MQRAVSFRACSEVRSSFAQEESGKLQGQPMPRGGDPWVECMSHCLPQEAGRQWEAKAKGGKGVDANSELARREGGMPEKPEPRGWG